MLAVRPPDYFPPAAHAALLAQADAVVIADTFAFSRQTTHNRARILTSQGAQWITVPRGHAAVGTPLQDVRVADDLWRRRHVRALRTAYGMAPFTEALLPEIEALLAGPHASIGALASATTSWSIRRLEGTPDVRLASEMPGAPATLADVWDAAGRPDLLSLTPDRDRAALADVWDAAGRPDLLSLTPDRDRAALASTDAVVHALPFEEPPRRQVWTIGDAFTPALSVLDVLLTYGPGSRDALGVKG